MRAAVLCLCVVTLVSCAAALPAWPIRGITMMPFNRTALDLNETVAELSEMMAVGANWLSIAPIWEQDNLTTSHVRKSHEMTPSDDSIRHYVRAAHRVGLHVMIKPIVSVEGNASVWIQPHNLSHWFNEYTALILDYAVLAEEEHVDALCIGVELSKLGINPLSQPYWVEMIAKIKDIYSGNVTYASLFYYEYSHLSFWSDLDWIGIDAYWPLAQNNDYTAADLVAVWNNTIVPAIASWRTSAGLDYMPVVYTELGYPSNQEAASTPGTGMQKPCDTPGVQTNLTAQATCYDALMQVTANNDGSLSEIPSGIFLFYFDNPTSPDYLYGGKKYACGFTPRGKPAYDILAAAWADAALRGQ